MQKEYIVTFFFHFLIIRTPYPPWYEAFISASLSFCPKQRNLESEQCTNDVLLKVTQCYCQRLVMENITRGHCYWDTFDSWNLDGVVPLRHQGQSLFYITLWWSVFLPQHIVIELIRQGLEAFCLENSASPASANLSLLNWSQVTRLKTLDCFNMYPSFHSQGVSVNVLFHFLFCLQQARFLPILTTFCFSVRWI